ncbi:MAG: dienelactone hydrolase family protein [Acidimicrobiales bacterium]
MAKPNQHALDGFEKSSFHAEGQTHDLYRAGSGPAVIVIHEVPGITPLVAAFGQRVAAAGFTAVLPNLFGNAGEEVTVPYALRMMLRGCVSSEFLLFATNRTSPITKYLRALAIHEHAVCGGPGVGAVGMCLTGGFALAMSVDDVMLAPVLSQPSMPLPVSKSRRSDLGLSDADLAVVKDRVNDGLCVMGLRFTGDKASPAERFTRLRQELGDNFIGVQIDSSETNPWGYRKAAHSVLTEDYSDAEGSPTRKALEDVLEFFASRLKTSSS